MEEEVFKENERIRYECEDDVGTIVTNRPSALSGIAGNQVISR